MNFGAATGEEESFRIMDRALELGINFFDSANTYQDGECERIIGRWMAQGNGRRDKVVLATKVYHPTGEWPNRNQGLSAYKIRKEVEESLQRLQTDHIDLYQMHCVVRETGWYELWGAFEDIVSAGKAIYIGSSNFAGWDIAWAQHFAEKRNFLGIVSEQHCYNLLHRIPELEILPCCKTLGVGVISYGPLSGGVLSGHVFNPPKGARTDSDWARDRADKLRTQLEAFSEFCRERGQTESSVAIAWILQNEAITSPIVGPRTLEQLEDCVAALDIGLDKDDMQRLDEIFPNPAPYY